MLLDFNTIREYSTVNGPYQTDLSRIPDEPFRPGPAPQPQLFNCALEAYFQRPCHFDNPRRARSVLFLSQMATAAQIRANRRYGLKSTKTRNLRLQSLGTRNAALPSQSKIYKTKPNPAPRRRTQNPALQIHRSRPAALRASHTNPFPRIRSGE